MTLTYRTYRIVPTLIAFVLFLLVGSLLVGLFQAKPGTMSPEQEVQAVYFAAHYAYPVPPTMDVSLLRQMLGQLDPVLASIADRVTIVSYSRTTYGFEMQVQHAGLPGRTFLLTNHGVR